jgi:NAD(P)-dependent dehydrogenase (short-subunit alcohol dehydrogenase family)
MVTAFIDAGAKVVIADVDRSAGEAVAAEAGSSAVFRETDVADPAAVQALVDGAIERFGGLHVMVNNAAIPGPRYPGLLETKFDDFDHVMRVNLLGVMAGTQQAARHMATAGGGSIINVSSIAGIQPTAGPVMYSASKAAIVMFTKCAAIDLGQHAVRVNCITPAHVPTPILGKLLSDQSPEQRDATLKSIRAGMLARQPLQRQGRPADVAAAALFFASDESCYVTGTVLSVDGGAAAGAPLRVPPEMDKTATAKENTASK